MADSKMTNYRQGLDEAKKRERNVELSNALTLELAKAGLCSSYQSGAWRIVSLPECPLSVQLEFDKQHVDIIPLSEYTKTIEVQFPLSEHHVPHHARLSLTTVDDIENIVTMISGCFPKHNVDTVKQTKRKPTKQKAS